MTREPGKRRARAFGPTVAFTLVDIRTVDPHDEPLTHRFWEVG